MPADTPVRDVMTTDVVTFHVDDDIRTAMQTLVDRGVDKGRFGFARHVTVRRSHRDRDGVVGRNPVDYAHVTVADD